MSSMTTPIVDFVRQYARSGISRLHMPGHKGQPFLGCEAWDITEIEGADELYEAEGIIARSEANATALFRHGAHLLQYGGLVPVHPGHAGAGAAEGSQNREASGAAGGPQRPQGPALCRRPAGFRHPVALAGPGSIRGTVQLPGDTGGPAQGAGSAGRAGDTALWRLRHQPGLSGQRAGYRRAGSRLQGAGRAPAGG